MNIVSKLILWSDSEEIFQALGIPGLTIERVESEEQLLANLSDCEAIVMSAACINTEFLDQLNSRAEGLRWLHLLNAGYDNVDVEALPDDALLTYSPGAGSRMVAEHGVALMLALTRQIPDALLAQGSRSWGAQYLHKLSSLNGKTAMIFGMGRIGSRLAEHLRQFRMSIIAVNRTSRASELADVCCGFDEVEKFLPIADFLIIATPLSEETRRFFNAERLGLMKRSAFLINLSRGALVDSQSLRERLDSGELAGAALDVVDPEPLPASHPLWPARNLIITPHVAAVGANSGDCAELTAIVAENARRFVRGDPLLHVVTARSEHSLESGIYP